MTVIDLHTRKVAAPPECSVLCLGNFDGVHIGHRELALRTIQKKDELLKTYPNVKSGAWFFRHAPLAIIKNTKIPLLTTLEQKLDLFEEIGLDLAFIYDYADIGSHSPEEFVSQVLKSDCNCLYAVCGYNFRFGKNAAGDATMLSSLMDGQVSVVDEITLGDHKVSSTIIRGLLTNGEIEKANALLGRSFSICEKVIHGKRLGRTIGSPTINQILPEGSVILKRGIYVSLTHIGQKTYRSVTNVGLRPSVECSEQLNCETYIIDFEGDLYDRKIKVEFLARLRDEIKFSSVDQLKEQIEKDVKATIEYFNK